MLCKRRELSQTVRLGAGQRHAEFEFTVGEIPIHDTSGNQTAQVGGTPFNVLVACLVVYLFSSHTLDQQIQLLIPKHPCASHYVCKPYCVPVSDSISVPQKCVSWRQTGGCSPTGGREPDQDKTCDQWITGKDSGYCECADGRKVSLSGCGHGGFTCADQCAFHSGKEIVSRFNTSIASASALLTDSNGRDMLFRKRNWRPSWNLSQTESIAGNYYPINSAIAIKDESSQLTLLVDRAQGGGSVADGVVELMVHRRLLVDDGRGVGEPLNETQFTGSYAGPHGGQATGHGLVVRGTHFVSLEPPANASAVWRPLADRVFAQPVLAFAPHSNSPGVFSALAQQLPDNVQLMTLQALREGEVLMRLSHQFGIDEDPLLSAPTQVDLSKLFNPKVLQLTMAREMSLTNNQKKSEIVARRELNKQWNLERPSPAAHPWRQATFDFAKSPLATLGPLEVKTFVLSVKPSSH